VSAGPGANQYEHDERGDDQGNDASDAHGGLPCSSAALSGRCLYRIVALRKFSVARSGLRRSTR